MGKCKMWELSGSHYHNLYCKEKIAQRAIAESEAKKELWPKIKNEVTHPGWPMDTTPKYPDSYYKKLNDLTTDKYTEAMGGTEKDDCPNIACPFNTGHGMFLDFCRKIERGEI